LPRECNPFFGDAQPRVFKKEQEGTEALFARKHNGKESEFCADLPSHLLKTKGKLGRRLMVNLAKRGNTTRNHVLELNVRERVAKRQDLTEISSEVGFDVQNPRTEPLLCVPNYLAWRLLSPGKAFLPNVGQPLDFITVTL
jgi:hypothetical protein